MRSVQLVASRTLEPREMAMPPDPGPGEVLVRVRAVGVCGSDMHWYLEGGIAGHRAVMPQVLGHEPAGAVEAAGEGVDGLAPGDKVAIEPDITCGECEFCRAGRHNRRLRSCFMGTPQAPGLLREFAILPARNLVRVPPAMSFEEAALAEPLAVLLHAVKLAPVRLGDAVAVLGAGPIGYLAAAVSRVCGAARVLMADPLPHRLALARAVADATADIRSRPAVELAMDETRGRGVDVVFDCAAAPGTLDLAVAMTRPGGTVVAIGIPSGPAVPFNLIAAMQKELRVQTVKRSNLTADAAIGLLASRRIPLDFITHRYELQQAPLAFATLAAYADGIGKAIIGIS